MARNMTISGSWLRSALAALGATAIGSIPAAGQTAGLLSGQFAGTAINSEFYRPPFTTFDGSPVSGTFLVDLTGCGASPAPMPVAGACLASARSILTAAIPGQSNSFGQPETLVQVFNTPSTQRLSITFGYMDPYSSARLELVGGANAFITGTDYSSLHAGVVDLAGSTLMLMGGRSYRAGVALGSFTFDQTGSSVPDAPTWTTLLLGFSTIGMAARVRRRKIDRAVQ